MTVPQALRIVSVNSLGRRQNIDIRIGCSLKRECTSESTRKQSVIRFREMNNRMVEELLGEDNAPLPSPEIEYLRGNVLLTPEAYRTAVKSLHGDRKPKGPNFGGVIFPEECAMGNYLFVGVQGAGKSTLQTLLMESVLKDLIKENRVQRALIHDHSADSIPVLYTLGCTFENGLLKTLNAYDRRGVYWDMAKDITNGVFADEMAKILIPENPHAKEPFWENTARDIVSGVICSLNVRMRLQWKFADLIEVLRFGTLEDILTVLGWDPENVGVMSTLLSRNAMGMVESILSTLRTAVKKYKNLAALWSEMEEGITVKQFLDESFVLLLGSYSLAQGSMETLNSLFTARLIDEILSRPGHTIDRENPERTWIILDEAPLLGKLEKLPRLLDLGRKKGVSLSFCFHDMAQLRALYGDLTNSLLAKFRNKAILRLGDDETAEWASSIFGVQEVAVRKWSRSFSDAGAAVANRRISAFGNLTSGASSDVNIQERKVVLPSEFLTLPDVNPENGLTGFFMSSAGSVKATLRWSYLESKRVLPTPGIPTVDLQDLDSLSFPHWLNVIDEGKPKSDEIVPSDSM